MNTKIKITPDNKTKIKNVFEKENGGAKANTLSGIEVFDIAKEAEERLENVRLPKKNRKKARAYYCVNGPANAYKFAFTTTEFDIERGSTDWFLVSVKRVNVYPRSKGGLKMTILESQAEEIRAKSTTDFHIAA